MDVCLRVLKESNKSRFDSQRVRNSVLIISHITFRDCRVHVFPDNPFSRNSCIQRSIKAWPSGQEEPGKASEFRSPITKTSISRRSESIKEADWAIQESRHGHWVWPISSAQYSSLGIVIDDIKIRYGVSIWPGTGPRQTELNTWIGNLEPDLLVGECGWVANHLRVGQSEVNGTMHASVSYYIYSFAYH